MHCVRTKGGFFFFSYSRWIETLDNDPLDDGKSNSHLIRIKFLLSHSSEFGVIKIFNTISYEI